MLVGADCRGRQPRGLEAGKPEWILISRIRSLRSRDEVLHALEHFPVEFKRSVLDAADRDALMRPAFDGGWGIVEILPHLRDWEEIYLQRANAVLTEVRPGIARI